MGPGGRGNGVGVDLGDSLFRALADGRGAPAVVGFGVRGDAGNSVFGSVPWHCVRRGNQASFAWRAFASPVVGVVGRAVTKWGEWQGFQTGPVLDWVSDRLLHPGLGDGGAVAGMAPFPKVSLQRIADTALGG